jgi:hypothetical protein
LHDVKSDPKTNNHHGKEAKAATKTYPKHQSIATREVESGNDLRQQHRQTLNNPKREKLLRHGKEGDAAVSD